MLIVLTDSTYNVVISSFDFDISPEMIGVGVSMTQESFIDGKDTIMNPVSFENVSDEIKSILDKDPCNLVYTEEEGFKLRPKILIEVKDKHKIKKISQDGSFVVPINEEVTLTAFYDDPDNLNFISSIKSVKMKDRNDFIEVPSLFEFDENGKFDFVVKSEYPGVAEIRAKDTKYICGFSPISVRFKQ